MHKQVQKTIDDSIWLKKLRQMCFLDFLNLRPKRGNSEPDDNQEDR